MRINKTAAIIWLTGLILFSGALFVVSHTKHFGMWASNVQHIVNIIVIAQLIFNAVCVFFAVRPNKVVEEVKPDPGPTVQQQLVEDVQKALPPKRPAAKKTVTKKAKPKAK